MSSTTDTRESALAEFSGGLPNWRLANTIGRANPVFRWRDREAPAIYFLVPTSSGVHHVPKAFRAVGETTRRRRERLLSPATGDVERGARMIAAGARGALEGDSRR